MSRPVVLLFACVALSAASSFAASPHLSLLLQQSGGNRLTIELRNEARFPAKIRRTSASIYDGRISARLTDGTSRTFLTRKYATMLSTGDVPSSVVVLQPGQSLRWTHSLSDFVDPRNPFTARRGNLFQPSVRTLAAIQPRVASLSAELDIYQDKYLGRGRSKSSRTTSIQTAPLRWTR